MPCVSVQTRQEPVSPWSHLPPHPPLMAKQVRPAAACCQMPIYFLHGHGFAERVKYKLQSLLRQRLLASCHGICGSRLHRCGQSPRHLRVRGAISAEKVSCALRRDLQGSVGRGWWCVGGGRHILCLVCCHILLPYGQTYGGLRGCQEPQSVQHCLGYTSK